MEYVPVVGIQLNSKITKSPLQAEEAMSLDNLYLLNFNSPLRQHTAIYEKLKLQKQIQDFFHYFNVSK